MTNWRGFFLKKPMNLRANLTGRPVFEGSIETIEGSPFDP